MSFAGDLDRWLTTDPREMSAGEEEAYEKYCEDNDLDPEGDHWGDFESAMEDEAEDRRIQAGEERWERDMDR